MKLNEEKVHQLFAAKDTLDKASLLLDEIINADATQADIARELGLTQNRMSSDLREAFEPFVRRLNPFTREEVVQYLNEHRTPMERLVIDILDLGDLLKDQKKVLCIDCADEEAFEQVMQEVLTERENKILRYRYGFDDGCAHTLDECSKQFGPQRERIRQIVAKAQRKLRQPKRLSRLLPDYRQYLTAVSDLERFKEENPDFRAKCAEIDKEYKELTFKKILSDEKAGIVEQNRPLLQERLGTPLSLLNGFPKDWADALKWNGCETVSQLEVMKFASLLQIARTNNLYMNDLYDACDNLGIHVVDDWAEKARMDTREQLKLLPVSELNASVRLYNCLTRGGCRTLGDVVKKTRKEILAIRNLGVKQADELEDLLQTTGLALAGEK